MERHPPPSGELVSRRMRNTPTRDTPAELAVRRLLHARGLRYRVDVRPVKTLSRKADIVFGAAKIAMFVDGCFWHACPMHGSAPSPTRLGGRRSCAPTSSGTGTRTLVGPALCESREASNSFKIPVCMLPKSGGPRPMNIIRTTSFLTAEPRSIFMTHYVGQAASVSRLGSGSFQQLIDKCMDCRPWFGSGVVVWGCTGDDFPGGREMAVAPAFDVPGFGVMAVGEGGELDPGDQVEGEGGDVRPGLVRGEVEERQLAQAGVFQGFDPVLAPATGTVAVAASCSAGYAWSNLEIAAARPALTSLIWNAG